MSIKEPSIQELRAKELMALAKRGKLTAERVVEFARNPNTACHSAFGEMWDDAKAAHAKRLNIAMHLIVSVTILPHPEMDPVQAFVSLRSDRSTEGGGYRSIRSVMSDKDMREELLQQALEEFKHFESKYKQFNELMPIFKAANKINERFKKANNNKAKVLGTAARTI